MAVAGLFPGQGSQSLGMLAELAKVFPVITDTFQEASESLQRDLWLLAQEGPETQLNTTTNTQPIMLAAGVACWRLWQQQDGASPAVLAGHSLGEYSALVASEVIGFTDAMQLVSQRAQLMQNAVPAGEGAMAAVLGLDDEQIVTACQAVADESNEVVEAVNFNAPGQVVIAGSDKGVSQVIEHSKSIGAKRAIKLAVSVPSHCSLMRTAAEQLSESLENYSFGITTLPVLHNLDAKDRHEPDQYREALYRQLYQPVRWVDTIKQMREEYQADIAIEFGPGKVLAGLNRRIDKKMQIAYIADPASLENALNLCKGDN